MPQLNPGDRRFLNLEAGKVLTVSCDAISSAIVRSYPINGGESTGQTAIAASGLLTRGPYASASTRWCIEAAGAGVSYSVDVSTVADVVLDASGNPAANGSSVSGAGTLSISATGGTATGATLTAVLGAGWSVTGYQWTRDGVDIAGATASTYVLSGADAGKSIGCRGVGAAYTASITAAGSSYPAGQLYLDAAPIYIDGANLSFA